MTAITPDTFDGLRRYVGVRLQQGVPLVDADWNEHEDARRFELRAFLKWFVGDGVPFGNDGFAVVASGFTNDFTISAGKPPGNADPLRNVGRIIVDGLDVMIEDDVRFREQKLHVSRGAAADTEAALLGFPGTPVPKIAELPNVTGTVTIYLDVWERLVTPTEDPKLVLPGLGTESCARLKREWVVRARQGSALPQSGDADFALGHSYYALARIARAGAGPVSSVDVTDRRERGLAMTPASIVSDTVGGSVGQYRQGGNRPLVNLREAINALMRGELPSTPDTPLAPAPGVDLMRRAFAFDGANGLVAMWASDRGGPPRQIYTSRLDLTSLTGFTAATPITVGPAAHEQPHLTVLPNRDVAVAYTAGTGVNRDVKFKRSAIGTVNTAPEQDVAATGGVAEHSPTVLVSTVGGTTRLVFLYLATNQWNIRLYDLSTNAFPGAGQLLASAATFTDNGDFDLHAVADANGAVWAAWSTTGNRIHALTYTPGAGTPRSNEIDFTALGPNQRRPFVLAARTGAIWLFFESDAGLFVSRFRAGSWGVPQPIPATTGDRECAAIEAPDGGIWLFRTRGTPGDIVFARLDPNTLTWSNPRQTTSAPTDDSAPFALADLTGATWLIWASDRTGDVDLYYKRLLTQI